MSKPSTARDAVAVLAVIVAFFTRTQFVLLAVVLPVAVASFELRRVDSRPPKARIRGGIARVVERHRLLTVLVGIAVAAVISLAVVGKLHAVLGSYGRITRAGIPHGVFQGLFEHLATLALALGVLPMIVAAGWITPRVWKDDSDDGRAFACVAATTILVVLFAGTIFDLHLGAGQIVYDRYLFYAAPLVLVAAVAAFETAPTWPGMIGAGAAIAVGFVVNVPPAFEWRQFETLNADAPATAVYRALTEQLHGLGVV